MSHPRAGKNHERWAGIGITLLGALLFSGKAVLAKLVYRHSDMTVVELLVLRMAFALPFFILSLTWALRQMPNRWRDGLRLFSGGIAWQVMLAGMLGYYVSSFFDFWGLRYISAGLERVILFSYPAWVVLLGQLLLGNRIGRHQVWALLLSYAGIVVAFAADYRLAPGQDVWLGSLLIACCALTFSLYVLWSSRLIPRVGVGLFTPVAMISATLGVFIHAAIAGISWPDLSRFTSGVYGLMLAMGVLATVVPSYLVAEGLRRIGSNNMAIVSSMGPVFTLFLAYWFLQEPVGWMQILGTLLVIAGVLAIGLAGPRQASSQPRSDSAS